MVCSFSQEAGAGAGAAWTQIGTLIQAMGIVSGDFTCCAVAPAPFLVLLHWVPEHIPWQWSVTPPRTLSVPESGILGCFCLNYRWGRRYQEKSPQSASLSVMDRPAWVVWLQNSLKLLRIQKNRILLQDWFFQCLLLQVFFLLDIMFRITTHWKFLHWRFISCANRSDCRGCKVHRNLIFLKIYKLLCRILLSLLTFDTY